MSSPVLVPLNGSSLSEQALPDAERLAQGLAADLLPLRVVEPGLAMARPPDLTQPLAGARTYLDGHATRLAARGPSVETRVVQGEPAAAITRARGDSHADLVVMATHARGAPGRWWFGSVADALLRQWAGRPLIPAVSFAPGGLLTSNSSNLVPSSLLETRRGAWKYFGGPLHQQSMSPGRQTAPLAATTVEPCEMHGSPGTTGRRGVYAAPVTTCGQFVTRQFDAGGETLTAAWSADQPARYKPEAPRQDKPNVL